MTITEPLNPKMTRLIACETVATELRVLCSEGMLCKSMDFGLHNTPEQLNTILQQEIDTTREPVSTILFGYGMCSKGLAGLRAGRMRLVIPKAHDCIPVLLGANDAYRREREKEPGTFYLSPGWIEHGEDPYSEFLKLRKTYGHKKALRIEKRMMGNYKRIALINNGAHNMSSYRAYGKRISDFLGFSFEEIFGSTQWLEKLISGNWDENFVVVEPGERVDPEMFG